jgi:hypothetical protein
MQAMTFGNAIEISALITAVLAAILWAMACRHTLRRVSKREVVDASDLNRMIVVINRSQILNARAALMTALSTLLLAIRFAMNLWPGVAPGLGLGP